MISGVTSDSFNEAFQCNGNLPARRGGGIGLQVDRIARSLSRPLERCECSKFCLPWQCLASENPDRNRVSMADCRRWIAGLLPWGLMVAIAAFGVTPEIW